MPLPTKPIPGTIKHFGQHPRSPRKADHLQRSVHVPDAVGTKYKVNTNYGGPQNWMGGKRFEMYDNNGSYEFKGHVGRELAARLSLPSACRPMGDALAAQPPPEPRSKQLVAEAEARERAEQMRPGSSTDSTASGLSASSLPRRWRQEFVYGRECPAGIPGQGLKYPRPLKPDEGVDLKSCILSRGKSMPSLTGEQAPTSTRSNTNRATRRSDTAESEMGATNKHTGMGATRGSVRPDGTSNVAGGELLRTPFLMHMFYPKESKHVCYTKDAQECRSDAKFP